MIDERPRLYFKVEEAKKLLNTANTSTDIKTRLLDLILEAGVLLETETKRRFDRYFEIRRRNPKHMSIGGHVYDVSVLSSGGDLQAVTSVTNGDGVVLDLDDIELRRSPGALFYSGVALLNNTIQWASDPNNIYRESIVINGLWGYGGRWKAITTLAADITSSATSMNVAAVTGFEQEMLLKIENELLIVDVTPSASPVTINRGANGSTAVAHLSGATVYEFLPDRLVSRFIKRIVQWYSELDKSPLYGTVQLGDVAVPIDISAIPKDAIQMIEVLRRPAQVGSQQ